MAWPSPRSQAGARAARLCPSSAASVRELAIVAETARPPVPEVAAHLLTAAVAVGALAREVVAAAVEATLAAAALATALARSWAIRALAREVVAAAREAALAAAAALLPALLAAALACRRAFGALAREVVAAASETTFADILRETEERALRSAGRRLDGSTLKGLEQNG
eukprot:CAMPEP_0176280834 /NCGR_PEP_ID=MMETSP0121_2-20121125/49988_1 /TAXON_ID=160619 /ORGANISM="Kryptoperidinium foliaceum, Strain CCMP 1326" /LENGTH=168 /DNA_ID=CAMNT_0017621159 /DNA_START=203 /DNA_END=707 /DNA_ORIENTATION=+